MSNMQSINHKNLSSKTNKNKQRNKPLYVKLNRKIKIRFNLIKTLPHVIHLSQTLTGLSQPLRGTGFLLLEQSSQTPFPQSRQ